MLLIEISGKNGLGKTHGVELAPKELLKGSSYSFYKKINPNNGDIEEQENQILEQSKDLMTKKPFFIGGDHSISYPLVKNFIKTHKNAGIVVLDAHPDLMPPMENPTHEEWLAAVIELGFNPKNILLIGARNIDPEEEKHSVNKIKISELNNCQEKLNTFLKDKQIYLSMDIDFFDSSIASATGYPEKDGATESQGLTLIKQIIQNGNVCAADLVEVNPTKQNPEKTIALAKKIINLVLKENK
ncbi:MAG TPA: arginase family protein [Candidatus Pacearchaeota archaeon]|nr:arginase family protein [Candidatus Pacearchaeota archaeon]